MAFHRPPETLIRFVAKTGFISRELWQTFFAGDGQPRWLHKMWEDLRLRGYFNSFPEKRIKNVYVLNRGNRVVRDLLHAAPIASPRAVHLEHDEILYQGVLLSAQGGLLVDWKSEPELKAMGQGTFKTESANGSLKYPDALFHLRSSETSKKFAVECELTQKSSKRYGQIMGAYAGMKDLSGVLYVAKNQTIIDSIRRAMSENFYPAKAGPVVFTSVDEWKRDAVRIVKELCINSASSAELGTR